VKHLSLNQSFKDERSKETTFLRVKRHRGAPTNQIDPVIELSESFLNYDGGGSDVEAAPGQWQNTAASACGVDKCFTLPNRKTGGSIRAHRRFETGGISARPGPASNEGPRAGHEISTSKMPGVTDNVTELGFSSDSDDNVENFETEPLGQMDEESAASLTYSIGTEPEPARSKTQVRVEASSQSQSGIEVECVPATSSNESVETENAVSKGTQGRSMSTVASTVSKFEKSLKLTNPTGEEAVAETHQKTPPKVPFIAEDLLSLKSDGPGLLPDINETESPRREQRIHPAAVDIVESSKSATSGNTSKSNTPARSTEVKSKQFYEAHQLELSAKIQEFQQRREARMLARHQEIQPKEDKTHDEGTSKASGMFDPIQNNTIRSKNWPRIATPETRVTGKRVAQAYLQALSKDAPGATHGSKEAFILPIRQATNVTLSEECSRREFDVSQSLVAPTDHLTSKEHAFTTQSENALVDSLTVTTGSRSDQGDTTESQEQWNKVVNTRMVGGGEHSANRVAEEDSMLASKESRGHPDVHAIGCVYPKLLDDILQRQCSLKSEELAGPAIVDVDDLVSRIDSVVHRLVRSGKLEITAEPDQNRGLHERTLQRNTIELLRNLSILRARRSQIKAEKSPIMSNVDVPTHIFQIPKDAQKIDTKHQSEILSHDESPTLAILRARRDHAINVIRLQTQKLTGRPMYAHASSCSTKKKSVLDSTPDSTENAGTRNVLLSQSIPLGRTPLKKISIQPENYVDTKHQFLSTKSAGPPKPEIVGARHQPRRSCRTEELAGQSLGKKSIGPFVHHQEATRKEQRNPPNTFHFPPSKEHLCEEHSSSFDTDMDEDDDTESVSLDDIVRLTRIESMIRELRTRRLE